MIYTLDGRLAEYREIARLNNTDWRIIAHLYMHDGPGITTIMSYSWFGTSPHDNRFSTKVAA